MKLLPVCLLLCLASCAPVPAQAQPAAPVSKDYAAQFAQAQAGLTQQADQRQQAAQSTAVAIQEKQLQTERQAQQAQASLEAARLAMQQQAAQETRQAAATADYLSGVATRQAISATATISALQAQALQAQATATAQSVQATAQAISAKSSQEALLIPQQGRATAIKLSVLPTQDAAAFINSQRRKDQMTSAATVGIVIIALVIAGVSGWSIKRLRAVAEASIKARTIPADRPALPAAEPAAQIEAQAQPLQIHDYRDNINRKPPSPDRAFVQFVTDCATAAGWEAQQIPSRSKLVDAGVVAPWSSRDGAWQGMIDALARRGLIIKHTQAATAPWFVVDDGTLRELYAALSNSYPSPTAADVSKQGWE